MKMNQVMSMLGAALAGNAPSVPRRPLYPIVHYESPKFTSKRWRRRQRGKGLPAPVMTAPSLGMLDAKEVEEVFF